MNYFVLATHAVTAKGEWVTPEYVQQVDFDSLHCIYCKLQIGVQFNPLTTTKTFVHLPGHINNVALLKKCRFNKHQTVQEQTSSLIIPLPQKRLPPANTAIRLYGNGDVAGVMSAGMGRRDVLNVLTGLMQPMRKRLYRQLGDRYTLWKRLE